MSSCPPTYFDAEQLTFTTINAHHNSNPCVGGESASMRCFVNTQRREGDFYKRHSINQHPFSPTHLLSSAQLASLMSAVKTHLSRAEDNYTYEELLDELGIERL